MATDMTLVVERPVAGGYMLARHDGRTIFVRGAIPGERVAVRTTRVTKHVAWAEVVEVLDASPDRRPAPADSACGGAHFAHIAPARQLALKAEIIADAFRRIGKHTLDASVPVAASPERGYRLRARLHVQNRRAGFFREGTHALCDAALSAQLDDATMPIVEAVVAGLGGRADDYEALVVAENITLQSRVVHLEARRSGHPDGSSGARLEDIADVAGHALMRMTPGLTGLSAAAGQRRVVLAGVPTVRDTAADLFGAESPIDPGTSWTRHATSFFQGNRFLAGALARHVLAVAAGDTVTDLYSGVGLFAVALAARGARVTAVEGDESSGGDLSVNALPWADRLTIGRTSVEAATMTAPADRQDVVVVDPPRTGMSPDAIAGLLGWRVPRVVYVSCDPPTLARDAVRLFAAGYRLTRIDAFDLFPNTPHVETVAVFDV